MWLGSWFSALPMEIDGFESPSKSAGKQTRKRAKLGDSGEKKFNATRPAAVVERGKNHRKLVKVICTLRAVQQNQKIKWRKANEPI